MKILMLALALTLLAAPASAASFQLGKPGYGGTGCPGGTASTSLSGDGTSLSVRFRAYKASAGGGKSFDRKACALAIPLSVPAGKSVAILGVDFAGTDRLPAGASSTFKLESFVAGGNGPVFSRSVKGPKSGKFALSSATTATTWSACGADLNLRTNSSLIVRSTGAAASTSISSQDVNTALLFRLKWKNC